jgi:GNAT superfamily N-acetyltransferase
MSIQVRELTAADFEAWLPLWNGYLDFYSEKLPEGLTELTWQRIIDTDFNSHGLGAFEGENLIGIVHYNFQNSTISVNGFVLLEDLFVSPDTRGKGVGRKLIDAVKERAEAAGCSRLYWDTDRTNKTARKLYDSYIKEAGKVQYRLPLN